MSDDDCPKEVAFFGAIFKSFITLLKGAKGFYKQLLISASLFWIVIRRSKTANLVRNLIYISPIHVVCRNNLGRIKSRFSKNLEIQSKNKRLKYFQEGWNKKSSKYFVIADLWVEIFGCWNNSGLTIFQGVEIKKLSHCRNMGVKSL